MLQLPPIGGDFGSSFNIPTTTTTTPTPDQPVDLAPEYSDEVNEDPRLHVVAGQRKLPAVPLPVPPTRRLAVPVPTKAAPKKATAAHLAATKANAVKHRQRALDHHSGPLLEYLHSLGATMAEQVSRHATVKAVYLQDTAPPPSDTAKLSSLVESVWLQGMQDAYADAADMLGTAIPFDLSPDVKAALDAIPDRVAGIDATTTSAVRQAVDAAGARGQSVADLAGDLPKLGAFGGSRAVTIAQSEDATAYNTGTTLAYRQSGMVDAVEVSDGDGDPECAAANGAIWTLDDAADNPLEHPNCVRSFSPVMSSTSALEAA